MIERVLSQVRNIFVGRNSEIVLLNGLWELACEKREHLVYVFLNAPGVGKTTLLNFFGNSIEREHKGLYINYTCSSEYNSQFELNKDFIYYIQEILQAKHDFIIEYIDRIKQKVNKQALQDKLEGIAREIDKIIAKDLISLTDLIFVLKRLSAVIPIFLAADEIQEFQKVEFRGALNNNTDERETALHYFTRLLKVLLKSRILLILSGTRYHILSQIGGEIGSPIRQKVKPLVIQKFNEKEVLDYSSAVKKLIIQADLEAEAEEINTQIENYKRILFAFSGGHPRTIENITDHFLKYLSHLLSNKKYLKYNHFVSFFLPKLKEYFKNSILSSYHKESLSRLAAREPFSIVKEWILEKGSHGQFLGERPKRFKESQFDEEIGKLVYDLMNVGIIVQNGNYNYHLTSYFHLLEFISLYNEPYDQFLKEVLLNKYFMLMCGSHSGFGYTFETIFTSALLLRGSMKQQEIPLNVDLNQIESIKVLKGKISWEEIQFKTNILYQTPLAEAIDAVLVQSKYILLIQITTADPPDLSKVQSLKSEMDNISNSKLSLENSIEIIGWFVSLFKFKEDPGKNEKIIITTGEDLIPILGNELFKKLKQVKKSF